MLNTTDLKRGVCYRPKLSFLRGSVGAVVCHVIIRKFQHASREYILDTLT